VLMMQASKRFWDSGRFLKLAQGISWETSYLCLIAIFCSSEFFLFFIIVLGGVHCDIYII
jgi:hypothetical protein